MIIQNKSSLLNELKSLIPTIDESRNQTSEIPQAPPPPPPPQSLLIVPNTPVTMTTFLPSKVAKAAAICHETGVSPVVVVKSPPPVVAPKNFNASESRKKQLQVLSMRDNLMDSIKGFNVSNLRKISN